MSEESTGAGEDKLLRLAIELSPAGMLAVDESGRITLVNQQFADLVQYTPEELTGQPIELVVPARFRNDHPQHRHAYFQDMQARPMGNGRDLYAVRKDGHEVPVEIGLNPVKRGDRTLVLASVVDISARRRAEARFQAAVESSPSGMLMTDADGRILLVNQEIERTFGYSRSELIGQSVDVLVPERLRVDHPSHRHGFFTAPRARPMGVGRDLYGLRKDGREILIEIGLNPITTEEGLCVLCSVVDMTARRQTEDQLQQAQKMEAIGTLAGGIAHDFNNILLSIVGYTELVRNGDNLETQQKTDLDQVLVAADRGRQLVQRILTYSRQKDVARAPLDAKQTVHEILSLLRASLPKTIEIDEILSDSTPPILSDATQLQQVIMNLATNAANAMANGGVLRVMLESCQVDSGDDLAKKLTPGLYARIRVQDTGHGMTDEIRERAMEPFFTTAGTGRGTGLGLAVVHGIIEAHQGAIVIDSMPDQGTTVDVYLPTSAALDAQLPEAPTDADDRRHILLVEDEVSIAAMLRRQINTLGYRVSMHTSSLAALDSFHQSPDSFDLLVTDNSMPKMTGMALAQKVLAQRPDLPVLLISGLAEVADPQELRDAGITATLAKPHTMDQLREAVSTLLGRNH